MRKLILYGVVVLLLVTCLVCPVMQTFDRWDHELQTGQDTEAAMVVVALCLAVTFALVQALLRISPALWSVTHKITCSALTYSFQFLAGAATGVLIFSSPPPTTLRI